MPSHLTPLVIALLCLLAAAVLGLLYYLWAGLRSSSSLKQQPTGRAHSRSIIVPLLDPLTWRAALEVACDLARERGAGIVLVQVLEIPWTLGLDVPLPEAEEKARALLETARSIVARRNLSVESRVLRHRAATDAILELSRETGAEVIVAGSSTQPLWAWTRRGRTVRRLYCRAPGQVILVRAPGPAL
jgi:nucleotide-binding universal stress UspA family protein